MVNLNLVLILKVFAFVITSVMMVVGGFVIGQWVFSNVISGDGRLPNEINHGVSIYYVDSLHDYFTDGVTCANWVNDSVELVKYPQYISKSICASYIGDE